MRIEIEKFNAREMFRSPISFEISTLLLATATVEYTINCILKLFSIKQLEWKLRFLST